MARVRWRNILFLLAIGGTSIAAVSSLPIFHEVIPDPMILPQRPILTSGPRTGIPPELAWFFVKFPYASPQTQIQQQNRHMFRITDEPRRKLYIVSQGQRYRRVEIYEGGQPDDARIWIFTPGQWREVWMKSGFKVQDTTRQDGNMWMWQRPLWNATHLKIYGITDLWLNAPYRKYSCAGFVHQFLKDAGVAVPIKDAWDMAKLPWTRISRDELEPGDILTIRAASRSHRRFWGHNITHVGVYIGNGKMIHASTASRNSARSFIRVVDVQTFGSRIDKILRPPELL